MILGSSASGTAGHYGVGLPKTSNPIIPHPRAFVKSLVVEVTVVVEVGVQTSLGVRSRVGGL